MTRTLQLVPENPVLPDHPDWEAVFDRKGAPLHVELGSGHGGFALATSTARPELNFVALEQRKRFADQTRARAAVRGLKNLLVLQGDAQREVLRLFNEGSVDALYVHFPDPWWKRRHLKRRLVEPRTAGLLLTRLKPGGVLDLRTDVLERAVEMRDVLEGMGFENLAGRGRFSERAEGEIPSTREKRYLASGLPVYRLRLRRPESGGSGSGSASERTLHGAGGH
jgi:tRNA (guanine-N7-)-methyltransferase